MTWIRVECSGGARYAAPSFCPLPALEGLHTLFSSPDIKLRRLQCFPVVRDGPYYSQRAATATATATAATLEGGCPSLAESAVVLFDQVSLGGWLGIATIAAGGSGADADESVLRGLLRYAEKVLRTTSGSGVRALLDAVCTLAAPPVTGEEEVVEADGGGPLLLPSTSAAVTTAATNRVFLNRVRPGGDALPRHITDEDSTINGASSSSSSSTLSATTASDMKPSRSPTPKDATAATTTDRRPVLSPADCARRRALLHFTGLDAVPLSLLLSCSSSTATATAVSTAVSVLSREVSSLAPSSSSSSGGGKKDSHWPLYVPAASEATTAVVAAMRRMLTGAFPAAGQATRSFLELSLWAAGPIPWQPTTVSAPPPAAAAASADDHDTRGRLFACAFSPSGLLVASPSFWQCCSHNDRFKISAAAVDGLARGGGPAAAEAAHSGLLLRYDCFPLLLTEHSPTAGTAAVVDLCLVTVGDALALVFGFPRQPPPATADSLTVDRMCAYLDSLQQVAAATVCSGGGGADHVMRDAAFAVSLATRPFTEEFCRAVFAVASLPCEEFIRRAAATVAGRPHPAHDRHHRHADALAAPQASGSSGIEISVTVHSTRGQQQQQQVQQQSQPHLSATPPVGAAVAEQHGLPCAPQMQSRKSKPMCMSLFSCFRPNNKRVTQAAKEKRRKSGGLGNSDTTAAAPSAAPLAGAHIAPAGAFPSTPSPSPQSAGPLSVSSPSPLHTAVAAVVPEPHVHFLSLCHAAVSVTHVEYNACRDLEGSGVAAFTWVATEEAVGETLGAGGKAHKRKGKDKGGSAIAGGVAGHLSRYAVSFFRPTLQQQQQQQRATSMVDLVTVADPTRLHHLLLVGGAAEAPAVEGTWSAVTVMPAYAIEEECFVAVGGYGRGSFPDEDDDEEDDVLTCVTHTDTRKVSGPSSSSSSSSAAAAVLRTTGVLACLQGPYLGHGAVLRAFLARVKRGSSASFASTLFRSSSSSSVFDDKAATAAAAAAGHAHDEGEARRELRRLCEALAPSLRAADILTEAALSLGR